MNTYHVQALLTVYTVACGSCPPTDMTLQGPTHMPYVYLGPAQPLIALKKTIASFK